MTREEKRRKAISVLMDCADAAKGTEFADYYLMGADAIRAQETEDKPLTLDEMREMGGKPYWHVSLRKESPPPHWNILDPFYAQHIEGYKYGENWLAYRRKPEEPI